MVSRGQVVVTCGPAYAPIDAVRRITNHSTGELGIRLANRLAEAGWEVVCCLGEGATWPGSLAESIQSFPFGTNEELLQLLQTLAAQGQPTAVFHAAALCDFRLAGAAAKDGTSLPLGKIPSRVGTITLRFEPAPKVLSQLRALFPQCLLAAWKYEVEGTPEQAREHARRQLLENQTDLCILNGPAFGPGFAVLSPAGPGVTVSDKTALALRLSEWLEARCVGKSA